MAVQQQHHVTHQNSQMTVAQLKEACKKKKLSHSGRKDTLVGRLQANIKAPVAFDQHALDDETIEQLADKAAQYAARKVSQTVETTTQNTNKAVQKLEKATDRAEQSAGKVAQKVAEKAAEQTAYEVVKKVGQLLQPAKSQSTMDAAIIYKEQNKFVKDFMEYNLQLHKIYHLGMSPHNAAKLKAVDARSCEECELQTASLFCSNCGVKFCAECSSSFHTGKRAQHELFDLVKCYYCKDAHCDFACGDCDLSFCKQCKSSSHDKGKRKQHACTSLN